MALEKEIIRDLITQALEAREFSYAPYSGYAVGAALMTKDGEIYRGCNVENASYGATNCAERTAFFKAVSEGKHDFKAIAIVGGIKGQAPVDYAYPCGVCRQVICEFTSSDFPIVVAKSVEDYKEYTLEELLPCSFGGESIR